MKIFSLEKKEYKKEDKEFQKTFVGKKLKDITSIFEIAALLTFFMGEGLSIIFDVGLDTELNSEIRTMDLNLSGILLICALISYYVYFKYLAKYIESKK